MPSVIKKLEIFATGVHNAKTGPITVEKGDLDQIVEAFKALQGTNIVKPHLKLGHTEAQKWFGQQDGIPTLGWITDVWVEGSKLLARIEDVPDALMSLIKAGRYHNVSAEIFWNAPIKLGDKLFKRVLSAVSLLGVEMPAVKDLSGLAEALFGIEPSCEFTECEPIVLETVMTKETPNAVFSQDQVDQLVTAAVQNAMDQAQKQFSEQVKSLKTELEVTGNRAKEAETKLKKFSSEAIANEAKLLSEGYVKDGKILPKQLELCQALLSGKETMIQFSDGEKSVAQMFKDFLDLQKNQVDLGEKGTGENRNTQYSTAGEEVDAKVKEFIATSKDTSYSEALEKVLASDPDLADRYSKGVA